MQDFNMDTGDKMTDLVARRFRALGEPSRLRVLHLLENGEMTVGDIAAAVEGNQPNVSKHLQVLHETGIVSRRRVGNTVFYSIRDPFVFTIFDLACRSEAEKSKRESEALRMSSPSAIW
ncbi:MAG: metalloregulator ArsR/SmtB family transcription factor [Acidobacteriaceae bacterium]